MRRLLALAGLAGAVWWLFLRRKASEARAVVGYADGSSISLESGSPALDQLVNAARRVVPE